jgi:exonuclease III
MDPQNDKLTLMSYNSTGLGADKKAFIGYLLKQNEPDVMLLQETWLLPSNIALLDSIHNDYAYYGTLRWTTADCYAVGLLVARPFFGRRR